MNENLKAWIEALRSGEYTPGKLKLRSNNNKFCCLGVGCDLLRLKSPLVLEWKLAHKLPQFEVISGKFQSSVNAPAPFFEWIGKPHWLFTFASDPKLTSNIYHLLEEFQETHSDYCEIFDDALEITEPNWGHFSTSTVLQRLNDDDVPHPVIADFIVRLHELETQDAQI